MRIKKEIRAKFLRYDTNKNFTNTGECLKNFIKTRQKERKILKI